MGIKGKCNCRSYNAAEQWGGDDAEAVLDTSPYFPEGINGRTSVSVDACMAGLILDLWRAGIKTVGCCCGHNRRPAPDIIVSDPCEVGPAAKIAARHITVPIQIFAWVRPAD